MLIFKATKILTSNSRKRNIFLIIFTLLFINIKSQLFSQTDNLQLRNEQINKIRLETSFVYSNLIGNDQSYYALNLNLNSKKHVFFGGVVISPSVLYTQFRSKNFENDKKIKIGFNTGYEFYLLYQQNSVNLFIKYEFLYEGYNKALLVSHYYKNNEQFDILIDQVTYSLYNLIGVGAKISVTPKMCINLSINSGLDTHMEQASMDDYGTITSRQTKDNFLAVLIQFGFRYDILHLK